EDDASIVGGLKKELQAEGYEVAVATRGDNGLAQDKEQPFDVVITDLKMPGLSGLELVEQLHATKPKLPIILVTAFGTTETAIEATKLGAYDYLLKPFDMAELLDLVAKSVACNRLMSEPVEMGEGGTSTGLRSNQSAIVGNSRAMQAVYKEIGRVAATAVSGVTITLPPLSQRPDDIPDLVKYFMQRSRGEMGVDAPPSNPEAIAFLQNQAWPGNVREL